MDQQLKLIPKKNTERRNGAPEELPQLRQTSADYDKKNQ